MTLKLMSRCLSTGVSILVLASWFAPVATAGDSGRRYDRDNAFRGTYRVTESGTIRLYDENGRFEGTVVPDRYRQGYRRYDDSNRFIGTVREMDPDE